MRFLNIQEAGPYSLSQTWEAVREATLIGQSFGRVVIIILYCFYTGEIACASVFLWRHHYTEGMLFWDIEMIKMLRMSSGVSVCDTGNCCLQEEDNKDNCLLGESVLEFA